MRAEQAGSMPARSDRQEIGSTHVEAVLEPYSDQGSIPCASMLETGRLQGVPFFCAGAAREDISILLVDNCILYGYLQYLS